MTTVSLSLQGSFTKKQRAKAQNVRELLQITLNSHAFQQAVRDTAFLDVRLKGPDGLVDNSLTNEQILQLVLTGTEQGSSADYQLELRVDLYRKLLGGSTIGYHSNGIIHTRTAFFNRQSRATIAGHWLHEWCHVAGFQHDHERTERRPGSVPYRIGYLLAEYAGGNFDVDGDYPAA